MDGKPKDMKGQLYLYLFKKIMCKGTHAVLLCVVEGSTGFACWFSVLHRRLYVNKSGSSE